MFLILGWSNPRCRACGCGGRCVCVRACIRARVCVPAHLCPCPHHQHPCPRPPTNVVAEFSAAVPGGGSFRGCPQRAGSGPEGEEGGDYPQFRNFPPTFGHQWGWCRPRCSFSKLETLCLGHLGPWALLACEALLDSLVRCLVCLQGLCSVQQDVFGGFPMWTNHFLFVEIAERTQER